MRFTSWMIIVLIVLLSACADETNYAPVTEISTIDPLPKTGVYRVQKDDTLYSIAWRYGLDYRYLAHMNNIDRPYHIEVGELIYLKKTTIHKPKPQKIIPVKILKKQIEPVEKEPTAAVSYWRWPARGTVLNNFSGLNKGINIGGHFRDPIFAAAPGKVVYSGNGLRAYGNLIIIKHNSTYLSAYAFTYKVLVKEGDWVKSGQKIAEMGETSHPKRDMLHFEIRRNGKPVNPLRYLAGA